MARTRAKFQCHSVTDHGFNKTVKLGVVYSRKDGEENYDFTKATPNGTIEMQIDNPNASVLFHPQRYYYVEFEECPEDKQQFDMATKSHKTDFRYVSENLNPKGA